MTVDDGDDDVTFLPTRKGRGRPRGPDWRKDYKCPHCGKLFAQKGNLSHDRNCECLIQILYWFWCRKWGQC